MFTKIFEFLQTVKVPKFRFGRDSLPDLPSPGHPVKGSKFLTRVGAIFEKL